MPISSIRVLSMLMAYKLHAAGLIIQIHVSACHPLAIARKWISRESFKTPEFAELSARSGPPTYVFATYLRLCRKSSYGITYITTLALYLIIAISDTVYNMAL